jgi:hypothetical protein
MEVGSGRADVSELIFRVYQRALHPDWFTTRQHGRFEHQAWKADVRIIDGGHTVTWSAGPTRVTEILTGPRTSLPEKGVVFRSPVRHERSALIKPHPSLLYQTCFEAEHLDRQIFAHLCDEVALDGRRQGLFYRAPTANRLVQQPISFIRIESNLRSCSVFAVHTFPDERAIVRSQTLFELSGEIAPA